MMEKEFKETYIEAVKNGVASVKVDPMKLKCPTQNPLLGGQLITSQIKVSRSDDTQPKHREKFEHESSTMNHTKASSYPPIPMSNFQFRQAQQLPPRQAVKHRRNSHEERLCHEAKRMCLMLKSTNDLDLSTMVHESELTKIKTEVNSCAVKCPAKEPVSNGVATESHASRLPFKPFRLTSTLPPASKFIKSTIPLPFRNRPQQADAKEAVKLKAEEVPDSYTAVHKGKKRIAHAKSWKPPSEPETSHESQSDGSNIEPRPTELKFKLAKMIDEPVEVKGELAEVKVESEKEYVKVIAESATESVAIKVETAEVKAEIEAKPEGETATKVQKKKKRKVRNAAQQKQPSKASLQSDDEFIDVVGLDDGSFPQSFNSQREAIVTANNAKKKLENMPTELQYSSKKMPLVDSWNIGMNAKKLKKVKKKMKHERKRLKRGLKAESKALANFHPEKVVPIKLIFKKASNTNYTVKAI